MSMAYIRRHYGVPAKRGMRVTYLAGLGERFAGVIVGSKGAYLRIRIGDNKLPTLFHPTYNLEYR